MPARDAEATIRAALSSVLRSEGVAFEVVVVDHGSRDATRDIALAMARADGRVRVVEADPSLPLAAALEVGRAACQAPFLARMDADDLMHPRRLAADAQALDEDPRLSAVACRARLFPLHLASMGMRTYVAWQNSVLSPEEHAREIWIEQPLCHPATTFRAAALNEVGGYRAGDFAEDYELFLRLLVSGHCIRKRPVFHHGWREHGRRATWKDGRMHRDTFARLKARALVERYGLRERPVLIAGAGKEGGRIARSLVEVGVQPVCFFDVSERRIGRVRYSAPVLPRGAMREERQRRSDAFLIGAVGTSGARGAVRAQMAAAGFVEGVDAVVVA